MVLSKIEKNARRALLHSLCQMISEAKTKNKANKVPYGYYGRIISDMEGTAPWLTISIVKKAFQKYEKDNSPISSSLETTLAEVEGPRH